MSEGLQSELPPEEKEIKYLENFEGFDKVSRDLLPENLEGKKILDVGAGASTNLERMVEDGHGMYMALDINQEYIDKRGSDNKRRGDATKLPFPDKSFDVAHSRFVLLHLPPESRQEAIREMDRVGQQAVILDQDWQSYQDKITEQREEFKDNEEKQKALDAQEQYINNLRLLAKVVKREMDMGRKLKEEAENALHRKVREQRLVRPPVEGFQELIKWGEGMIETWRNEIKDDEKAKEMQKIIDRLKVLDSQGFSHSMPDLVAVIF